MTHKLLTLALGSAIAFSASAFDVNFIDTPVNLSDGNINISRDVLSNLPEETVMDIKYTINPGTETHCFKIVTAWGGKTLTGFEPNGDGEVLNVTTDGTYKYTFTAEAIADLKDQNFHGWDPNVTITGAGITVENVSVGLAEVNMDDEGYGMWPGLLIPNTVITTAQPGWRLEMVYTKNTGAENGAFRFATNYGNTVYPSFVGTDMINDHLMIPVTGDGSYKLEIAEEDIEKMADSAFTGWDGLRILGHGFTITKMRILRSDDPTSGIDNVTDVDTNAPVVYYNLQGVRVNNPANGIYIRVQGNKATKELFK